MLVEDKWRMVEEARAAVWRTHGGLNCLSTLFPANVEAPCSTVRSYGPHTIRDAARTLRVRGSAGS